MNLQELWESNKSEYRTDKGSGHNYLYKYSELFADMRLKPIKLLEIGVYFGGSLKLWRDWFPHAQITGIDISYGCLFQCYRIKTFLCNSVDPEQVKQKFNGKLFDIIIDDGSHKMEDQIQTFQNFKPFFKAGSYYIIEDLNPKENPDIFRVFRNLGFEMFEGGNKYDDFLAIYKA